MRAAVSEFLEHGFEKGNVGDIAKNAGVAKGSMYQYFENKKELFLYAVQWASDLFLKKYDGKIFTEDTNLFDYAYFSSRQMYDQLKEEKELAVFLQDVILGKYSMVDESISVMLKMADDFVLRMIGDGKKKGYIRKDIDDGIMALFLTGATMKIKENILSRAHKAGNDIIDEGYEKYDKEIKAMLELIKNGMGEKTCL